MAGCIVAAIVLLMALAFSWFVTCGILYLIALCFGLTFTWPTATGIWLILFLLSCFLTPHNNNSKK